LKAKVFDCLFLPEAFLSCFGKKGSKEADLVGERPERCRWQEK